MRGNETNETMDSFICFVYFAFISHQWRQFCLENDNAFVKYNQFTYSIPIFS